MGYMRRVAVEGGQAVLAKRGAREAGAIHVRIVAQDGDRLYSPVPMSLDDDPGAVASRRWSLRAAGSPRDIDDILARELGFDGDAWVIDVDDREGRDWFLPEERAEDFDTG